MACNTYAARKKGNSEKCEGPHYAMSSLRHIPITPCPHYALLRQVGSSVCGGTHSVHSGELLTSAEQQQDQQSRRRHSGSASSRRSVQRGVSAASFASARYPDSSDDSASCGRPRKRASAGEEQGDVSDLDSDEWDRSTTHCCCSKEVRFRCNFVIITHFFLRHRRRYINTATEPFISQHEPEDEKNIVRR